MVYILKHIPRVFITELLMHVDIVDIINSRVRLARKGDNFYALCPFHVEKNPSFVVSKRKQFYYCFGCSVHGNVIDFLMHYDRISFVESIEELSVLYNVQIPYEFTNNIDTVGLEDRSALYAIMQKISDFYQRSLEQEKCSDCFLQYFQNRKLDNNILKEFSIGYSPSNAFNDLLKNFCTSRRNRSLLDAVGMVVVDSQGNVYDRFCGRIIFPIYDNYGRVVAFGGRSILFSKKPKYINSPETRIFHKTRYLYGLYNNIILQKSCKLVRLIVVEGYMDVLTLRSFGIFYVVALLGSSISSDQIRLLYRFTNQVIFCYDGDSAGRISSWKTLLRVLPYLTDDKRMNFVFLPAGEDPDSLIRKIGKGAFERYIDCAQSFSIFFFKYLISKVDFKTLDGRLELGRLALPLINKIPGKIFRIYLRKKLGYKIGIFDEYSLDKLLSIRGDNCVHMDKRNIKFTVMRILIGLLVQNPRLFIFVVTIHGFEKVPLPGLSLFVSLIRLCTKKMYLTTGQLLECYRDSKYYGQLKVLSVWQHMICDEMVEEMFIDSLIQLYNSILGYYRDQLIFKDRLCSLNTKDREMLWFLNKTLSKDVDHLFYFN
ncbi:MAG: DNA primase [Candidatus Westeberhardia cardiocondylae]|nr:DNA primase [Candidatus Westeberhardia cardiocondylae]